MKAVKIRKSWTVEKLETRRVFEATGVSVIDHVEGELVEPALVTSELCEMMVEDFDGETVGYSELEFDPSVMFTTGSEFVDYVDPYTYDDQGNAYDADGNMVTFEFDDSGIADSGMIEGELPVFKFDELTDTFVDPDGNPIEVMPYWRTGHEASFETTGLDYDPIIAESGVASEEPEFTAPPEVLRGDVEGEVEMLNDLGEIAENGVGQIDSVVVFNDRLFDAASVRNVFGSDLITTKSDLDNTDAPLTA
jgi:hypothetical protein